MMVEIWRTLVDMHNEPPRHVDDDPRGELFLGTVSLAACVIALCCIMALVCP